MTNEYGYVQIRGTWYHLQNQAWDILHNGSGGREMYPLGRLAALAYLCGGRVRCISAYTDVAPDGEGPAKPGYLLPYVPHNRYSPRMLRAMHRRLEQLGLAYPKRLGAGYRKFLEL